MSYIMGWPDVYLSHHYVTIYWDTAVSALTKTFPGIKLQRFDQEHVDNKFKKVLTIGIKV
jgi:hypothetical protein